MGKLRAYMVHDGDPGEIAVLVFDYTARKARNRGRGYADLGCDGFLHTRAEWIREGAEFHRKSDEPHVIESPEHCAECTWWYPAGVDAEGLCPTCAEVGLLDAVEPAP